MRQDLFVAALIAITLAPSAAIGQAARRHRAVAAPDPWSALLLPTTHKPLPTTAAITAADLKTRLFIFAADSMQGRRVGTDGNVKGVEYLAREAKRIGLLPAGQDGTFFQTVEPPLEKRTFDTTATITAGINVLTPWVDYFPRDPRGTVMPIAGAQVIYGGTWTDSTSVISADEAAGKFVVITSATTGAGNPVGVPNRPSVAAHFSKSVGVAVVAVEGFSPATRAEYHEPLIDSRVNTVAPAYLYITRDAAARMLNAPLDGLAPGTVGATLSGALRYISSTPDLVLPQPLRNVVALLPGSDKRLQQEFVVIGAHNDHIGNVALAAQLRMTSNPARPAAHDSIYVVNHLFRPGGADDAEPELTAAQAREVRTILARVRKLSKGKSARIDSVYNGADDDGSGSVSLLEIAQYLASLPVKPKRSILFVWHVGEEAGLWGSQYFTDHPTVPRDAIVAELNMDMVGRGGPKDQTGTSFSGQKLRGGPGYLQVVGSRRLSTELGDIVESVNTRDKHQLHFDYSMDANGHPQNIYCRSDHAEYARYGIPVAFFTTGGHADYHQLTDEPQYIDYNRMAQVDEFVADLARHVANLDHRVAVDHPVLGPDAVCRQ